MRFLRFVFLKIAAFIAVCLGFWGEAEEDFANLVKYYEDPKLSTEAVYLNELGLMLYQDGDIDGALDFFQKAWEKGSITALGNVIIVLWNSQEYDRAYKVLEREDARKQLSSKIPEIALIKALLLYRIKKKRSARKILKDLDPSKFKTREAVELYRKLRKLVSN